MQDSLDPLEPTDPTAIALRHKVARMRMEQPGRDRFYVPPILLAVIEYRRAGSKQ